MDIFSSGPLLITQQIIFYKGVIGYFTWSRGEFNENGCNQLNIKMTQSVDLNYLLMKNYYISICP
jgi:hypothetical protein